MVEPNLRPPAQPQGILGNVVLSPFLSAILSPLSVPLCPHSSVPSLRSSILPPSVPLPPTLSLCLPIPVSLSLFILPLSVLLSSSSVPLSLLSVPLSPTSVSTLSPLSAPGSLPLYAPSFSTMSFSLPFLCLTLSLLSVPTFPSLFPLVSLFCSPSVPPATPNSS